MCHRYAFSVGKVDRYKMNQSLKHPAGITLTPVFVVYAMGALPHIMIN